MNGASNTKLRLDKSHSSTPGSTKPTSFNDVSVSFDNLTNSNISYSNYQPVARVKKDLEQERRAIVGKKIGATGSGYSQLALRNKTFKYSAKKQPSINASAKKQVS